MLSGSGYCVNTVTPPGTKVPGVCLGQNARSSGSFVDRGVSRMGEESEWGITTCCFAFIPGINSGAFPLIIVTDRTLITLIHFLKCRKSLNYTQPWVLTQCYINKECDEHTAKTPQMKTIYTRYNSNGVFIHTFC